MQDQLAATDQIILAACLSVDYWHQSCSFLHSLPRIIKFTSIDITLLDSYLFITHFN